tara:strand:- start:376 stop:504 length:129 start_codon:yes stop_codon:yes gene_type:complete
MEPLAASGLTRIPTPTPEEDRKPEERKVREKTDQQLFFNNVV